MSPYGTAYLNPCKYPFPLKSFHFWIFKIFILVAILKILKTKITTLSDDLFLCQVSKGSGVRFPFNIFCILVTMATATILNVFNPSKAVTHYSGYSYKVSWSLMKGIQKKFKSLFFVSMATAAKFVQPILIFLAYLVPLDVDVVPIKFRQFLFVPTMFHEVWWKKSIFF